MIDLGVNIDHVATLRQARRTYEPDPVWAAAEAHLGGADCITVHLREDRRHIVDRDVELLRQSVQAKLNLEMAATDEMVDIACRLKPEMCTLVPEGRHEVTTEGGLDVAGQLARLQDVVIRLQGAGIYVSIFIDADLKIESPQTQVIIDRDKAAAYGISMQQIGDALATMTGGNYVNLVNLQGRSYQVIPQVPREFRLDPAQLGRYHVRSSSGAAAPLSTFGTKGRSKRCARPLRCAT